MKNKFICLKNHIFRYSGKYFTIKEGEIFELEIDNFIKLFINDNIIMDYQVYMRNKKIDEILNS